MTTRHVTVKINFYMIITHIMVLYRKNAEKSISSFPQHDPYS